MEDGIEMYRTTLYDSEEENLKKNKRKRFIDEKKQYVYIFVPKYGELQDCIVTYDNEEALKLSINTSGTLRIFYKDPISKTYVPTFTPFSFFTLQ